MLFPRLSYDNNDYPNTFLSPVNGKITQWLVYGI